MAVSGYNHMPIYVNADTATPQFDLIRVLPGAAGQKISFGYFDAGDAPGSGAVPGPAADRRDRIDHHDARSRECCAASAGRPGRLAGQPIEPAALGCVREGRTEPRRTTARSRPSPSRSPRTTPATSPRFAGCWYKREGHVRLPERCSDVTTWDATVVGRPGPPRSSDRLTYTGGARRRLRPRALTVADALVSADSGVLRCMSGSPHNDGLGAYGERVAARRLVDERHGRRRPQLAVRPRRDRPGAPRRDVLVFCEVKTRTSAAYGHPLEAVTPAKARAAAAAGASAGSRSTTHAPTASGSTSSGCWSRSGARPRSSTSGGWADGRHHAHRLAPGRRRPRRRRPGRPVRRAARDGPGRPARRVHQRGPRPVPRGGHQQRPALAQHPPDHVLLSPADLPKRGPHFDLGIAVAVLAAAKGRSSRTTRWSARR